MSKITKKYRCNGDCEGLGSCDGHTAELEFHSTSGILEYNDGDGERIYFDLTTLKVFKTMLEELSEIESGI